MADRWVMEADPAQSGRWVIEASEPPQSPGYEAARTRQEALTRVPGMDDFTAQMANNLGVGDELRGAAAFVGQGAENIVRRVRGKPVVSTAGEAGQAAMDAEREARDRYAREHPILNVLSILAGIGAGGKAGGVGGFLTRPTAVNAAMTAGGLSAPFAVARQEGTLPERLPKAVPEIGVATALGGAMGALGQALAKASPKALATARKVAQFDQAGVPPTLAATQGGMAPGMTKAIAENFFAGGAVRNRLDESIAATGKAADRIAGGYALPQPRELVGETVQSGVERFAKDADIPLPSGASAASASTRETSFAAKAEALYDDVFNKINAAESAARSGAGFGRGAAGQPITVSVGHTKAALDDILGAATSERVKGMIADPQIVRFREAIKGPITGLRFNDLRQLRTYVRNLQGAPQLRQGVDDAGLQRLEQALTQDIGDSARLLGGDPLAHQLAQTDKYYRVGSERIKTALKAFDPTKGGAPAQAFDRIIAMASDKSGTNTASLLALKRSLRQDEWRSVVSTIIDRMGNPNASAAGTAGVDDAFSPAKFATAYKTFSPEGRAILFGSKGGGSAADDALADELDNLVQVADMQNIVEAMTNRSRSGMNLQNFGTGMALLNPTTALPTAAGIGGMMGLGEALTNPAFVRWLASAPRAGSAGWRDHLAGLAQLAYRDPSLHALYQDLSDDDEEQSLMPSSTVP